MKSTRKEAFEAARDLREKAPSPKFVRPASVGGKLGLFPKGTELSQHSFTGNAVLSYLVHEWWGYTVYMSGRGFLSAAFLHSTPIRDDTSLILW